MPTLVAYPLPQPARVSSEQLVYTVIGGVLCAVETLGPRAVDISTVGNVLEATSVATIQSQIAAAVNGETVRIANGSYGLVTTAATKTGLVRIVPESAGGVSIAGVDMSGAAGLDWRGINTTAEVSIDTAAERIFWRGGTAQLTSADIGFDIRDDSDQIVIEDVTILDADASFNLQAASDAAAPTNVIIRHCRSEDVVQDHVFVSRCRYTEIVGCEFFGHTDTAEHSDGVQIVGGKDMKVHRCHIWNTRAFREAATDRNDHGIVVNYDDVEADRVPERIRLENLLIHDMTASGISIAGCLGIEISCCTSYSNGASGGDSGLNMTPDAGNVINGARVTNNIFNERVSGTVTYTVNSHNFSADGSAPGDNGLSGDPGFFDEANQDYRLLTTSQLVGAGTAIDVPHRDLYGVCREGAVNLGPIDTPAAPASVGGQPLLMLMGMGS